MYLLATLFLTTTAFADQVEVIFDDSIDFKPKGSFSKPPQSERTGQIDKIIINYSGFLKGLSTHYLIPTAPQENIDFIQMVRHHKAAWHSGGSLSFWKGTVGLNQSSIGIILQNPGFDPITDTHQVRNWYQYTQHQLDVTGAIVQGLRTEYPISPLNIVGHGEVGGFRDGDSKEREIFGEDTPGEHGPGPKFNWGYLYNTYKVGAWLEGCEIVENWSDTSHAPKEQLPQGISEDFMKRYMDELGYNVNNTANAQLSGDPFKQLLHAFKAHYSCNMQPDKYNADLTR